MQLHFQWWGVMFACTVMVHMQVGWWDHETQCWRQNGITDIQLDLASGSLSFRTTNLGAIAVIQSRTKLLPYSSWSVRPTGGRGGKTAAVTLVTPGCVDPVTFEVSEREGMDCHMCVISTVCSAHVLFVTLCSLEHGCALPCPPIYTCASPR